MITVDARGFECPKPVILTKDAMRSAKNGDRIEVLVDNDIAVSNIIKYAQSANSIAISQLEDDGSFKVIISVAKAETKVEKPIDTQVEKEEELEVSTHQQDKTVIVIPCDGMGDGNEELGRILMKSFIFAITNLEVLPSTMLFYNGGAKLTCEGSVVLEDLKNLSSSGVEILTCGTCLDFFGLKDVLGVGEVTNMYSIVEIMDNATRIIRP
ncbi:MAG: sulfurtransferase-like selenium metabolism protein YedF [Lachnospiraceae bacterium]|jgi:selenium metabolism protein YedF|nr:sulfurtransferase-like selenium metabolism protein YedF [Lachnospiraceae bacterium]